ncbi:hypothetical protein G6F22_012507 [Rhizopus arrhizus]|nr:hypothetical protein G6F22_012507 [Rhizopus arrhizus]KAG0942884.1 hypothetical protein G6F31_014803 [Rhizopus arrhizus]
MRLPLAHSAAIGRGRRRHDGQPRQARGQCRIRAVGVHPHRHGIHGLGALDAQEERTLARRGLRVDDPVDAGGHRRGVKRLPIAELEVRTQRHFPRIGAGLARQRGGQLRHQLALGRAGQQRFEDVARYGALGAVLRRLRVQRGRFGTQRQGDVRRMGGGENGRRQDQA